MRGGGRGRLWQGLRARPLRSGLIALLAVLVLAETAIILRTPRLDRDWVEHLSVTPKIALSPEGDFSIAGLRDWTYAAEGPLQKSWRAAGGRVADVRAIWFVVEPHPGAPDLMAHTLLLFEFGDDRLLGLTIEARREADEDYSAVAGLFNTFELLYVWASARDLLVRRAVYLDHDVNVYRLALTESQARSALTRFLASTQALGARPRFYHTLFSNCTNELGKNAGLGWHPSFVLTGRAAGHLHGIGLIRGQSFEEVAQAARMKETIARLARLPAPAFDAALLRAVRAASEPHAAGETGPV
ncbi:MAG: DUF4105 domain-containing protein [Alphaproteobacteria bacterium]|nr:DUF4105 domain-containing protein [Alphaproteobacteria bacterium]